MNLLGIRTQFVELSGRHDLVKNRTNYADNGANNFINWGQRYLDTRIDNPANWREDAVAFSQGSISQRFTDLRAPKAVGWLTASDGFAALEFATISELRDIYAASIDDIAFAGISEGTPAYWSIRPVRNSTPTSNTESETEIIVVPPPDKDITLVVRGLFFSPTLSADADVSFWSVVYPQTLIQAAMYTLERFYRNTEGMRDHLFAINEDLRGIDFDEAERFLTDQTSQMHNSF